MGFIDIDYKDTVNKAKQIKEKAEKIASISANNMTDDVEKLVTGWKGDSSSEYYKKYYKANNKVKSKAEDLAKVAESMRKTANALYEAEEYGKSLFSH